MKVSPFRLIIRAHPMQHFDLAAQTTSILDVPDLGREGLEMRQRTLLWITARLVSAHRIGGLVMRSGELGRPTALAEHLVPVLVALSRYLAGLGLSWVF